LIGSDILDLAYDLTNRKEATFLDGTTATAYKRLNMLYGERVLDILRARVDKNASMEEATTTLKSTVGLSEGDNGYNGEYAFPTDLLKPNRVEVSYDGSTWLKCEIYDNAINLASEYNERQLDGSASRSSLSFYSQKTRFSQTEPKVDFTRNSFKIRPIKRTAGDIANGIYIEYEKRQDDFSSTTAPAEIESNLQNILAYDLAELEMIMHADKYDSKHVQAFQVKKKEVENRFKEYYKKRLNSNKQLTTKYLNYR
jgi:hypothetical protein